MIASTTSQNERKTTDHLENNLAKFGYILDMKVETKNLSIFFGGKFSYFFNLKQMISNFDTYEGFLFERCP
jgi:hypothetical protein